MVKMTASKKEGGFRFHARHTTRFEKYLYTCGIEGAVLLSKFGMLQGSEGGLNYIIGGSL